jgi:ubiquinone/menaquinone biosynthesis C-methylase UbiE
MSEGSENVPRNLTIEIGAGTDPIVGHLKPEVAGSGEVVVMERRKVFLGELARSSQVENEIIQADASNLPIKSETVDTVVCKDFFGSHIKGLKSGGRASDIGDIDQIANQIGRVTKSGGKLVVIETLTPGFQPTNLLSSFKKAGFSLMMGDNVEKQIYKGAMVSKLFKGDKAPENVTLTDKSFALILTKS